MREVTLDPLVHPESRVFLALLARREPRVILVPRELLVKTVLLALGASPEKEVFLVQRVQQV